MVYHYKCQHKPVFLLHIVRAKSFSIFGPLENYSQNQLFQTLRRLLSKYFEIFSQSFEIHLREACLLLGSEKLEHPEHVEAFVHIFQRIILISLKGFAQKLRLISSKSLKSFCQRLGEHLQEVCFFLKHREDFSQI